MTRLSSAAGVTAVTGRGFLEKIVVGDPGASWEIEIFDGTSSSGTRIGTIKRASQPVVLEFNVNVVNGVFVNGEKGTTVGDLFIHTLDGNI